jgi:hypothetical protein
MTLYVAEFQVFFAANYFLGVCHFIAQLSGSGVEGIKAGAGREIAPSPLSNLHLLWLAWQGRIRITNVSTRP